MLLGTYTEQKYCLYQCLEVVPSCFIQVFSSFQFSHLDIRGFLYMVRRGQGYKSFVSGYSGPKYHLLKKLSCNTGFQQILSNFLPLHGWISAVLHCPVCHFYGTIIFFGLHWLYYIFGNPPAFSFF